LRGLDKIPTPDGQTYADRIAFISGVSGGAVTAAYFGLKGRQALTDFRERFLLRDAEENLTTAVNLATLLQGVGGGVNESSKFTSWLDRNLYDGATMVDLFKPGRPIISINASDLYNRTPFHFSPETFNALCSDLRKFPLSQAVAASAAVPVAFTPIVLESFPDSCTAPLSPWVERALSDPNAGAQVRAYAKALVEYRKGGQIRFVKLADGGITDNFGLAGIVVARSATANPYRPLSPEHAVKLRHVIFIVVNAGRGPEGDWSRTVEGPSGKDLIGAITDTAVDSAVRSGFDAFRLTIREWQDATRKWRCALPRAEAVKLGAGRDWRCSNIKFEIIEIAFDHFEPKLAAKLQAIPTRFRLPPDQVELLIQAGSDAVTSHPTFGNRRMRTAKTGEN
jgi:predicted acylesterase/phospholipase RssA